MKDYVKSKPHLKKDITPDRYPELYEIEEEIVKVNLNTNFIKVMQLSKKVKQLINKNLWKVYIAYLYNMLDYVNYDNVIDFYWIVEDWFASKSMMENKVKPKFKKIGLIKKYHNQYYLNPLIWTKAKVSNPNLINLFKEDNEKFYNIKL